MVLIRLPADDELSDEVKRLFETKIKSYIKVPVIGSYTRSLSYKPRLLENMADEHLHIMMTRELPRKTKEMIATAVSMTNSCTYCTVSHAGVLKAYFNFGDEELVELTQLTAHFSALGVLENAYSLLSDEDIPKATADTLKDIEGSLGRVPKVYRIMVADPDYLKITWEREKAIMNEGKIDATTKRIIALAILAKYRAGDLFKAHWAAAKREGVNMPQLMEALHVVHTFQKNNVHTTGLNFKEPPDDWWQELKRRFIA
ncbi:hypothetical protein HRbin01_00159 [archaeon HR01]|nr:hypothetical protein HRbin01_00159 [archaeon HR01]